jgi:hypothetical protein
LVVTQQQSKKDEEVNRDTEEHLED